MKARLEHACTYMSAHTQIYAHEHTHIRIHTHTHASRYMLMHTIAYSYAGPHIPWRAGRVDKADGTACPPGE